MKGVALLFYLLILAKEKLPDQKYLRGFPWLERMAAGKTFPEVDDEQDLQQVIKEIRELLDEPSPTQAYVPSSESFHQNEERSD